MAEVTQNAQLSSDLLHTMFASNMTNMIVLDLMVAATILLAHRIFLANERRLNATSPTPKE
ncbi:hypothetical protein LMIY3S_03595 [Labrys miyagiensis]